MLRIIVTLARGGGGELVVRVRMLWRRGCWVLLWFVRAVMAFYLLLLNLKYHQQRRRQQILLHCQSNIVLRRRRHPFYRCRNLLFHLALFGLFCPQWWHKRF